MIFYHIITKVIAMAGISVNELWHVQHDFENIAVAAAYNCIDWTNFEWRDKDDGTVVTDIDIKIDKYVLERLEDKFKDITKRTEESRPDEAIPRNTWDLHMEIDPTDGSKVIVEHAGITTQKFYDFVNFVKHLNVDLKKDLSHHQIDDIRDAGYSPEGVLAYAGYLQIFGGNMRLANDAFMQRIGEYGIMLGLSETNEDGIGEPVCGVVYFPSLALMFSASKGNGAEMKKVAGVEDYYNETRLEPPIQGDANSIVCGRYSWDEDLDKVLLEMGTNYKEVIKAGSFGYAACQVASGERDRAVFTQRIAKKGNVKICTWDMCAPNAINDEAGRSFTDLDGKRINYNQESPIFTGGVLVDAYKT
jgi:3'-phosphoadenosine 5'-phosphosulfate (PAPS) 3'-phosphatase